MMLSCFEEDSRHPSIPIKPLMINTFSDYLSQQSEFIQQWIAVNGFNAKPETICVIPDSQGNIERVLWGMDPASSFWSFGALPLQLPSGQHYHFDFGSEFTKTQQQLAILAWGLGSFRAYPGKKEYQDKILPKLVLVQDMVDTMTLEWVKTIYWVRTLINTPCEEMGPRELVAEALKLAQECGALSKIYEDKALLTECFPAVYAVGRASTRPPCLIDLTWGNDQDPKVTLVGKGVCFDTGGLNLKPSSGMRNMKKDMGGAAHVLGLARMMMKQQLPIKLRVIIPVVENVVSGNSIKPGDVLNTRAGLKVEVGNTDAEGRLILCDALTAAVEDNPEIIIDMATLTGAARVALGPDVPVYFSNNETVASQLERAAATVQEPLWRLPLYQPYKRFLKSEIADCNNVSCNEYGGAIAAALYLQQFVPDHIPWMHFDLMAWNDQQLPGRPIGGEAMALRTLFSYLQEFSKHKKA